MPFEFSGSLPLNPTPKSVITAMAGFEVAFAFPFVERFSGSGLGLKLRAPTNPGPCLDDGEVPQFDPRLAHRHPCFPLPQNSRSVPYPVENLLQRSEFPG